jgi:hypothetical protein
MSACQTGLGKEIKTVKGREILRRRTGKVRFGKDRQFATLPVKARELANGDYILILFGQTLESVINFSAIF